MKSSKNYLIIIVTFIVVLINTAIAEDAYIIRQKGSIKIMTMNQSWKNAEGSRFSELSFPVQVYLPFSRKVSLSIRSSRASAGGDELEKISGFNDTQCIINYHLEESNIVLNLSANLPTGKKEFNFEEFQTSYLLSYNHFNFQVPNFGQGLNISFGVTKAIPTSENLVLGFGASYQLKGEYKLFEDMSQAYDPGDELLITGGFDVRLSETSNLSTDVIYTHYKKDRMGGEEVFVSGNKIVLNAQFRSYSGYSELWLFGRYRSKGKNSLSIAGELVPEEEKSSPNQVELMGHYRFPLSPKFYLSLLFEGRFYKKTVAFQGIKIYGIGIAPQISLSPASRLVGRLKYLTGKYTGREKLRGTEIGLGIKFIL